MGNSKIQATEDRGTKRRILLGALSFGDSFDGAALSSLLVARMLEHDFDVTVLTGANGTSQPQVHELHLGPLKAAVPMMLRLPMWAAGITRQVEKVIQEVRPDLIHLQDANLSDPVIPVARRLGVPVIVTLRDQWFIPSFRHDGRHDPSSQLHHPGSRARAFMELFHWWRPVSWPLPLLLPWLYAKPARLKALMEQATMLLPLSNYLRDAVIRCGIKTPCEMLMLVPMPDWPVRPLRNARPVRFLSVGRLVERKGIHVLIQAFRRVLSELPGAELTIAGDGPQRARLQKLAEREGCARQTRFLGHVPFAEIPRLYEDADILVFPATFPEAAGRIALEAGMVGRPVIAARSGGLPEIIGTDCGVLVSPGAVDDLAAEMVALARDPERQERLARAAREQAVQFTFANLRGKLLDVYRRVLTGKVSTG